MAFTTQLSDALSGPDWLRSARASAAALIESTKRPSTEQELWRYSRIGEVNIDSYSPASPSADQLKEDFSSLLALVGDVAALVVTVDGVISHSFVADECAAKGLTVSGPDSWDGTGFVSVAKAVDIFGVLNEAFAPAPIRIDIPRGVVVDKPIVVVHNVSSPAVAVFPRLLIHAHEASQASVCELHTSTGFGSLIAPVVHHDVEQAANLKYVNAQMLSPDVHHIGYNASRVAQDANFSSTTVALGGDYARLRTDSFLVGKGANASLKAAFFAEGHQMHDFRTLQQHEAPKTTSDLLFKGAIGDSSRSVYSGLIRVEKGASGTNAFQTNRNLVLSDGAHAESVPNLEIEENDVKCSHASATGPIDEDHRYYLESRGVPTEIAERLLTKGFLNEVLEGVEIPQLRAHLSDEIAAKLDRVSAKVKA